ALEGWRYTEKPSQTTNQREIRQELVTAANGFVNKQQELLSRTEKLAGSLQPLLVQSRPPSELYQQLPAASDLWGIARYQKGQPVVWKGFARLLSDDDSFGNSLEPEIIIQKKNNVIYWESRVPFNIKSEEENSWYRLHTSYKIEQSNPLSIGSESEFNFFQSDEVSSKYPLNFSLFSELPSDAKFVRRLNNLAGDSVGVVYATSDKFEQTEAEWSEKTRLWRSVYIVFALIVLILLFFSVAKNLSWQVALLIQLFIISIGWLTFFYTDMLAQWILTLTALEDTDQEAFVRQLSTVSTHAIFSLLAALALAQKLPFFNRKINVTSYLSTLRFASFIVLVNALSIPTVINWLAQHAALNQIPVMDLRILPAGRTVLLYIVLGLALLALGVILITLNRLLLRVTREHIKVSSAVLVIFFLIGLFISRLLIFNQPIPVWLLLSCLCCFTNIFGFALGYATKVHWVSHLSPLRKIILGSIFIAGVSMPMLYHAYFTDLDNNLMSKARSVAQEE